MPNSHSSISLSTGTIRLLDGPNYAVLATINADGGPQTSAMWVGRDGNDLLMSTVGSLAENFGVTGSFGCITLQMLRNARTLRDSRPNLP